MEDRRKAANNSSKKTKTDWPSIKPKSNLPINRLKDDDLITIPNYFTSAESKAFINAAESIGFVHQGSLGPSKGEAYRDNDRISFCDPVLAEAIWQSGLKHFFSEFKKQGKVAVGLNPNIRLYRYKAGQRFGRHIDESIYIGEGRRTYYTLLIYLSGSGRTKSKTKNEDSVPHAKMGVKSKKDDNPEDSLDLLVGGETVFYGPRNSLVAEVPPTEGMALLHVHGSQCMLHEARVVSKGVNLQISLFYSTWIKDHNKTQAWPVEELPSSDLWLLQNSILYGANKDKDH